MFVPSLFIQGKNTIHGNVHEILNYCHDADVGAKVKL